MNCVARQNKLETPRDKDKEFSTGGSQLGNPKFPTEAENCIKNLVKKLKFTCPPPLWSHKRTFTFSDEVARKRVGRS